MYSIRRAITLLRLSVEDTFLICVMTPMGIWSRMKARWWSIEGVASELRYCSRSGTGVDLDAPAGDDVLTALELQENFHEIEKAEDKIWHGSGMLAIALH